MADRKRPTKKKATKKIKKIPKPDEKLKHKTSKKKLPCHPSISEHSVTRRRSGDMKDIIPKRKKSRISYKKSIENLYNKHHSKKSLHQKDSLNLGAKKKSSNKLKPVNYYSSDDDIVKKKSSHRHRYDDDGEIDLLGRKPSIGYSYRQYEQYIERKRSEKDNSQLKKKLSKDFYKRKYDEMENYSSNQSSNDMFKEYRNKRSSRVSLAGMYATRKFAGQQDEGGETEEEKAPPKAVDKFDFVARADKARTNLKLALGCLEICGVTFLTLMFTFGFSEDSASTLYFKKKGELNGKLSHFALAAIWVFVMGNAMIVFRVFNQTKVSSIKYFHLFLQALGFFFCVLSLHAYSVWWKYKKLHTEHNFSIHAKISILGMLLYFGQFASGLCVYSLAIFRQGFRVKFYHYHSFFGFAVFFMAITAVCTGIIMEEKYKRLGYSRNPYSEGWLPKIAGVSCVLFSGGVLFVIVYPYFDFEKEAESI